MKSKLMKAVFVITSRFFIIAALVVAPLSMPHTANASVFGDGTIASTVEINGTTTNHPGTGTNAYYGISVANIGDLDNDGVEDIVVGAHGNDTGGTDRGAVYIHFLDTDGSIKSSTYIVSGTANGPTLANSDQYGVSVAGLGDLDNDGVEDIAVGANLNNTGGADRGVVFIHYLNTNGTVKSTVSIGHGTTNGPSLSNGDEYGRSVALIGDLDNDGVDDIAVGAIRDDAGGGTNRGAIFIHYMNTNGSIDSTVEIDDDTANGPVLADGDAYGESVDGIGDLDKDGVEDILVGADYDDTSGGDRGAAYIHFMNTNGTIDSTVKLDDTTTNGANIYNNGARYGVSVTSIGDHNGDGVIDIAIGAAVDDEGGSESGAVFLHFMNTNGSIQSTEKIISTTTNGPTLTAGDYYGVSLALIGDLDEDGLDELLVGAFFDDSQGASSGAVHIHYMNIAATPTNDSTTSNTVTQSRLAAGESATYGFSFVLSNTLSSTLTITFPAGFTVTGALTSGTCTSGTISNFGYTSSTLTADKSSCTGTVTLSGAVVTNHSTPGEYVISWENDDPGYVSVIISDDDQVTVSAALDSTMSFNIGVEDDAITCATTFSGDGGTLALGTLDSGSVTTSDAGGIDHICSRVSTNATGGAIVTVKSLNAALQSTSVPGDEISSATATPLGTGVEGYGLCMGSAGADSGLETTDPVGSSPGASSPFNGTCTSSGHNIGVLTTGTQTVWSIAGPTSNAFARLYLKASISTSTPAHDDYTDTLTFIATGTY